MGLLCFVLWSSSVATIIHTVFVLFLFVFLYALRFGLVSKAPPFDGSKSGAPGNTPSLLFCIFFFVYFLGENALKECFVGFKSRVLMMVFI